MESYVLEWASEEVSVKTNQFGGVKGCSGTHMLINVWQKILSNLEDRRAATVLTSINYAKAFNCLSFQHCLMAFSKRGASSPIIELIASFLQGGPCLSGWGLPGPTTAQSTVAAPRAQSSGYSYSTRRWTTLRMSLSMWMWLRGSIRRTLTSAEWTVLLIRPTNYFGSFDELADKLARLHPCDIVLSRPLIEASTPEMSSAPMDFTPSPASWPRMSSTCLLYTSPSPRDRQKSRMPSSA